MIEFFRAKAEAEGAGYQTMINATLRATVMDKPRRATDDKPLTVAVLRKVLREVLHQLPPSPGAELTQYCSFKRF